MHSKATESIRAQRHILLAALLFGSLAAVPAAQAAGIVSTCDQTHLAAALAGGGLVTFNCSGDIALSSTLIISLNTSIDATGQSVTLDGGDAVQILSVNSGATLFLNNITVETGNGGDGGGVYNSGTLIVNKSTFGGNSANSGGAIYSWSGTVAVTNSTFSGNSAVGGGAILSFGGTLLVSNSTFSGNTSNGSGGAILNERATLTVINSTFSGNGAGDDGGAIYNNATATLQNTILAASTDGGNCYNAGSLTDGGYNRSDDGSCGFSATSSTNNDGNINLGSFSNGVFPLTSASDAIAAIPAGTNGCATTILTDQIGQARPGSLNGNCSIGAWEYVAPVTSTITDCSDDGQLQAAVRTGGRIVFACSGDIALSNFLFPQKSTAIDATGYQVTLDGHRQTQVFGPDISSTLILNNVTVANGANGDEGSGIYSDALTIVTNSTFLNSGGSNNDGGGIYNSGTLVLSNSTFSGNNALIGGAIFNGGTAIVTGSTFFGNGASLSGMIYNAGTLALQNTVIANTTSGGDCASNSYATSIDAGYNLDDDGTCGFSSASHSLSNDKNANLGSLSNNGGATQTVPLQYPSDAIDAIPLAVNGCGMSPDQRGVLRPQGLACDIGAYEANQIPVAFATNPANLSYTVGSTNYTAAAAPFLVAGAAYQIGATSPQAGGTGTQYAWQNWSDSGALSHSVQISTGTTSYTATFQTQYLLTTGANPPVGGSVTPASGTYYNAGTPVPLIASANTGYAFANWTGSVANPSSASTSVTMTGPQTVTANFVAATVNVTVGTSPAGLSFTVDNVTYTSAQMLTWTIGSKHSLSTSTPQTSPGTQYTFNNWSDGGTISHTVTAPGSAATYTAAFSTRYQLITGASPSAGGTVTPSSGAFYAPNTVVNLAAKSEAGYVFSSWTGSVANANNSSTTVTISGPQTVTANFVSALTVSPASINFGTVYLGSIHIQEVTLTNTGTTAITIKEPLFSILQGGNSSEFAEVSLCPASLAAGKQCTIAVSFIAGPFYTPQTAMMYVQDSAPNTPQSVALSATVIDPLALFQPLTLNFGTQKVKTSATQTVKLSNPGATALSIAAMTITGADPGDFKLTPASTCGSSLAPGASCQISVTFTPSASGQRCANLTVTDNALPGSQVVTLVGTGH